MKLPIILLFFISIKLTAQNDTIVTKNNEVIIGSVKEMNKSVLKLKTSYSDKDFAIKWSQVKQISSTQQFIISTTTGEIYNGKLRSEKNYETTVYLNNLKITNLYLNNIVYLRTLKSSFLSRLSTSLALGYNFTKSSNLSQFNLRSTIKYKGKKWTVNGNFNGISATREGAEAISRLDAAISYRYFLKKDWYPLGEINLLANTEQNIKLRTVARVGVGKYIKRTNGFFWGVQAGVSYNNERFLDTTTSSQNSMEGFTATELNIYNMGDLSLLTRVVAYPSFTESRRLRLDGVFDLQYDLPLDFFIKLGFTVNYDNRSVQTTSDYDYIFQTSFGWKL